MWGGAACSSTHCCWPAPSAGCPDIRPQRQQLRQQTPASASPQLQSGPLNTQQEDRSKDGGTDSHDRDDLIIGRGSHKHTHAQIHTNTRLHAHTHHAHIRQTHTNTRTLTHRCARAHTHIYIHTHCGIRRLGLEPSAQSRQDPSQLFTTSVVKEEPGAPRPPSSLLLHNSCADGGVPPPPPPPLPAAP